MSRDDQFDESFLQRLEYLYLVSQKMANRRLRANRDSEIAGSGMEFADHREYSPGDDFRNIDWKLYARTEKLFLKLFEEEQDLYIYFLLDCSRSMHLGESSKWWYAKRVVAALSYIGLSNLDRVGIIPFADKPLGRFPPTRGRNQIFRVFEFLETLEPGEATGLEPSLRTFVSQTNRKGMAVVLSDFFDPDGYRDALDQLRYHKFDPVVIQVYDRRELDPSVTGDIELVDAETGDTQTMTVTPRLVRQYRERFKAFSDKLESYCNKHQMLSFRTPVQEAFDDLILRVFRAGGFVD